MCSCITSLYVHRLWKRQFLFLPLRSFYTYTGLSIVSGIHHGFLGYLGVSQNAAAAPFYIVLITSPGCGCYFRIWCVACFDDISVRQLWFLEPLAIGVGDWPVYSGIYTALKLIHSVIPYSVRYKRRRLARRLIVLAFVQIPGAYIS